MNALQTTPHRPRFPRAAILASSLCAGLLLSLAGCGEATLVGYDDFDERDQPVRLVPEFSIVGADAIDDVLRFDELKLSISEIRLEPLETGDGELQAGSVAYSTRRPTRLHFDMAADKSVNFGEPINLPQAGSYLISVRLEPLSRIERTPSGTVQEVSFPSLSVQGFVSAPTPEIQKISHDEQSDGSPVPMPFNQKELDCNGSCGDWTPFKYHSRRASFITLNVVEVQADSEFLAFEFDVRAWGEALADPIRAALQAQATQPGAGPGYDQGVDVTNGLEDAGFGAESLLGGARVSSIAQVR